MPLFYQHNINDTSRLGVWHITEEETFFLQKVPLQTQIGHPHKRLQHLAGRYLLQLLFPDFPYDLILIADTRKPYLPGEQYHFSISHCGNYAAAIVSRDKQVGIDVEAPTVRVKKISHRFTNQTEWNLLSFTKNTPVEEEISKLTLLWSAKEAVFKWAGNVEVDFKDHILLEPKNLSSIEGKLSGTFSKAHPLNIKLEYKFFEELVLVWMMS